MKHKSERTKRIEKLDDLWSRVVRTRDGFHCQKEGCNGHGKYMHAAHINTRNNKKLRWNIRNGITLCYHHHIVWGHSEPNEFDKWIKDKIGDDLYNELNEISKIRPKPIDDKFLDNIEKLLKSQLSEYENRVEPF